MDGCRSASANSSSSIRCRCSSSASCVDVAMYRISLVRLPPDDGVVTRAQNRVDATNPVRFHIEVTSHRKKSLSFTKIFSCDLNVAGGRRKLLGAPGQLDLAASF